MQLKGKFFHTFREEDGKQVREFQGEILDEDESYIYAQLYEWMWGTASCCAIFARTELTYPQFRFYETLEDWNTAADKYHDSH